MLSRRPLLRGIAATATAGLAGLAGCSAFAAGVEGYAQLKSVAGVTAENGTRSEEVVLRVSLASPPGDGPPRLGQRREEWAARFENPRRPVVSDALREPAQAGRLGRAPR